MPAESPVRVFLAREGYESIYVPDIVEGVPVFEGFPVLSAGCRIVVVLVKGYVEILVAREDPVLVFAGSFPVRKREERIDVFCEGNEMCSPLFRMPLAA